tara:strand:+ start:143 stop:529 length:387 start_codon:yes stop_codon:yes gene_type:complete
MLDKTIENIAQDVVNSSCKKSSNYGNPLMIIMMIGIILNLIRVIQECNDQELSKINQNEKEEFVQNKIKELCTKRTWYNKLRMRRIIKNHMSIKEYKQNQEEIVDGILNKGLTITKQQVSKMMEASNV